MNNTYNTFDDSYDDLNDYTSQNDKKNDSVYDQLADFDRRLCISALTKAAEISPLATECTIGPNSCISSPNNDFAMWKSDVVKNNKKEEANLIEDRSQEDLRYILLRKKRYDKKLQENTDKLFNNLIEKMVASRVEVMNKYWKRQSEEYERRTLEQRKHKLLLLKGLRENDNLSVLENSKFDEQHRIILNKHIGESMNKILEEQDKATAQLESIMHNHSNICISYNELIQILQTDPLAKTIYNKYMNSMKTVIENTNLIMEFCKTRAVTDKEVKQLEVLAANIQNIKIKVTEELQCLKQQDMINKQKEIETLKEIELQKELELKNEQERREAEIKQFEAAKLSRPVFYSSKNYDKYIQLEKFLEEYENQYKDLLENPNLKKYRFDCQKAVNTPVNALSSVSGMHMKDKYDKLSMLLKGERVAVLDIIVSAAQHPQGIYYCTALLAKKIVRQGDLLVSSNPEAAFPLAAVAVALWSQFPDFGKLLEGYFQKHCPYLVPMFLPQKEGQTDKEFYMSRGYTYNDEGVVEKQDKFLKRMSGIFRLYCAIWIARTPKFLTASNPHGLKYGWQWLASFVNLRPEPDICATLLHDFITVCGSEFFKYYGKQFRKVLKLISTEYLKILEQIDEGGPKSRLEVFLQNVIKTGHIPQPSGLLKHDIW